MIAAFLQDTAMEQGQMLERLRRACDAAGSQSGFARRAGVLPQHISLVLKGQRPPGPRVLAALGLVRAEKSYRRRQAAE